MTEQLLLNIGGMQCSFCVDSIHKAYRDMKGIAKVGVNLSHEEVLIHYNPEQITAEQAKLVLRDLGYTIRDPNKLNSFEAERKELLHHQRQLVQAVVITFLALLMMLLRWAGIVFSWYPSLMFALTIIMIFGVGLPILKMAYASAKRKILNQHVLMELGAFGGLLGGIIGMFDPSFPRTDFLGAAIFITAYHILSGYVSLMVRSKSSQAIKKLMELQPSTAIVIRDGKEEEVPVEHIEPGEVVRVRSGENIPVDGIVIEGESTVNQSLVTGEPFPVHKQSGDEVIGGSINQYGSLLIKTTKVGDESFLQQVARSIQEARSFKPRILQSVEYVLKYFVPGVIIAAFLAFTTWTLGAWLVVGRPDLTRAIFATLAVLVMGYPCALGMATPLAMIRGGGLAAQQGVLMRSGEAYQIFEDINTIAFDKTGVITEGKPKVVEITATSGIPAKELLRYVSSIEKQSQHPLAKAIIEYSNEQRIESTLVVESFQTITGFGVKANIDTDRYIIGSPKLLKRENIEIRSVLEYIGQKEEKGQTVVCVAKNGELVGLIAISDRLKQDAEETILQLKKRNIRPVLLTGDNYRTAHYIAQKVGINLVWSELLPQQKAEKIREFQGKGDKVMMVGDGTNDAPALMQADIGVAFSEGTDIAIESADVVLVRNELQTIIHAYLIGKKSYKKTKQNIALAFLFNGIGIPVAMTGLLHPVFAMIAMVTSVTTVLLNSFAGNNISRKNYEPGEKTGSQVVTFSVPTIRCQGCVDLLTEDLLNQPGVHDVDGNPQLKTLTVTFDNQTHLHEINQTIEDNKHRVEKEQTEVPKTG